ncbi:hypothetical protein WJX73_003970 [Symbiochloris irregularis]|uniref:Uncharacterized protein n=1 Tax=Symbiochloris irregularis TaxID=706552 RepID=A0AAW1PVW7_9CHLO
MLLTCGLPQSLFGRRGHSLQSGSGPVWPFKEGPHQCTESRIHLSATPISAARIRCEPEDMRLALCLAVVFLVAQSGGDAAQPIGLTRASSNSTAPAGLEQVEIAPRAFLSRRQSLERWQPGKQSCCHSGCPGNQWRRPSS